MKGFKPYMIISLTNYNDIVEHLKKNQYLFYLTDLKKMKKNL